jgi:hypothetical protein
MWAAAERFAPGSTSFALTHDRRHMMRSAFTRIQPVEHLCLFRSSNPSPELGVDQCGLKWRCGNWRQSDRPQFRAHVVIYGGEVIGDAADDDLSRLGVALNLGTQR